MSKSRSTLTQRSMLGMCSKFRLSRNTLLKFFSTHHSESCIKGHRSSNCHHNDRPLFEIKKKGRPVSQCEKCREARQARRIHAKCTCETEKSKDGPGNSSNTEVAKFKRQGMCVFLIAITMHVRLQG